MREELIKAWHKYTNWCHEARERPGFERFMAWLEVEVELENKNNRWENILVNGEARLYGLYVDSSPEIKP